MKNKFLILLFFLAIFFSCSMEKTVPQNFANSVEEIRTKYAPDKRIALFNIDYSFENNRLIIDAETDNRDALEDLKNAVDSQ